MGGELLLQRQNGKAPCCALRNLDPEKEQGATSALQQPAGNSERLPGSCTDRLSLLTRAAGTIPCMPAALESGPVAAALESGQVLPG